MKCSLPGLFANISAAVPAKERDYYSFCLDEVLLNLRLTIEGKYTLQEFAEHYCLTDTTAEKR